MTPEAIELWDVYKMQDAALRGRGFLSRAVGLNDGQGGLRHGESGGGGLSSLYNDAPWKDAPPGSLNFAPKDALALPAVGAGDSTVTSLIVPGGYDGIIKRISNNFVGGGFVNASGDVIWRILINGMPVRNFSNIISEFGTQDTPMDLSFGIRVYSGDLVTYVVNHAANAGLAGNTVCCFEGYFYPARGE